MRRLFQSYTQISHPCLYFWRNSAFKVGGPLLSGSLRDEGIGIIVVQQLVVPLFDAIQHRLAAQDLDQEVKEAAISCAATIIACLGDITDGAYLGQIKVRL